MSGVARTVVVGGGSGFVGSQLCQYLEMRNFRVVVVGRGLKKNFLFSSSEPSSDYANRSTMTWQDIKDHGLPKHTVGVVNLAGENVLNPLKRWNEDFRKSVYTSRIRSTTMLADAVMDAEVAPAAFVVMSGVGFYPPGPQPQDETSPGGDHDFIANLAVAWEKAARLPASCSTRSVSLRSGVVLGRNGGMIQQLLPAFYLGLGGRMGSGDQPLAWIHVKDLARLIIHCIENPNCEGVINAVAPQSITNQQFANQFAKTLSRPAFFPTPEFVFNAVFGPERAAMITKGQVVRPTRSFETGFAYNFPTIEDACDECAHLFYEDPDDNNLVAMSAEFQRLPTKVVPSNYKLWLKPDFTKLTFDGVCEVKVDVKEDTDTVVCNASELTFSNASVTSASGTVEGKVSLQDKDETVTLKMDEVVKAGAATVTYTFTGCLNDKMRGFYRSKYTVDGEDRWMAVTQFESTSARLCFPCWDEPAVKATFDVTVVAPKDRVILSNMPEVNSKEDEKDASLRVVTFDTTPIMSTYLLAITVGEFDHLEGKTPEGIECRVYSPLGKKEQGSFALECAIKSLTFYKDFFNVPYPLKKYDMVAIPDFSSGAMENWGLVLYREVCLLVDAVNTSASSKSYVAIVVCHEAAHQWFGNLVTMEWWTHLWLNEGFASFMENLTTDTLYPEFKIWEQFVPSTLIAALELDALKSSHPIEVPVGHPTEVDEIFDNISYNKGASIIRMLYDWIGDEAFKSGMHSYLTKYAYKNTETPQLWTELEAASGKPVTAVMSTWTGQMGFPVIRVKSRQEGADRILTLSQSKFCADGAAPGGSLWQVPVSLKKGNSEEVTKVMLDQEKMEVRVEGVGENDWVKVNPGFVGYYRVAYERDDMERLTKAVQTKELAPVDRLQVIDDLFSLIMAGEASTVEGLRLLKAYKEEDSYIVWNAINNSIAKLQIIVSDQDCYENFKRFVLDIFSMIKTKTTWDPAPNETHFDTLLRSLVLVKLGRYGDEEVRGVAKRRFDSLIKDGTPIKADIRSVVYSSVAAIGDPTDYDNMVRLHNETELHEEKDRIARAGIARAGSEDLCARGLKFALSEHVRKQDSVHLIGSIAANTKGRDLAWQFFKDNNVELKERYAAGFLLSRLVKSTSETFVTMERAAEVETFFQENPMPGSERNVAQAVETVRLNAAWLARDGDAIKKFLEENTKVLANGN